MSRRTWVCAARRSSWRPFRGSGGGRDDDVPSAVRIGLVKTLFRDVPEVLIPIGLRPMKELMDGQTGVNGDLIPSGDADSLARQLKADEVQFGVFHGVEFAWVHQKYPTLKPLVIAVNGHPFLRAHLVVRADSKIGAAPTSRARS